MSTPVTDMLEGLKTGSYTHLDVYKRQTGMDAPLVYQLFCQGHRWVAKCGRDKR